MEALEPTELTNVTILGANGFVGSHLVDKFVAIPGMRVNAFDRFSRPEAFDAAPNVEVYRGDFFDAASVDKALENPDCVIHCFTQTNPSISDQNPYLDIDMLHRSVEIFSRCAELNVKKVVFISSGGAIYGEPLGDGPSKESDCPNPVSPYGIGKLAIENYLAYFKRKTGMDYVTYRLTNPYGPRQVFKNGQGVIAAFIEKIKKDEQLTILGDGSASRDYIYIEDAAQMIADSFGGVTKHPIYNLGSGEQTSLNAIIQTLGEQQGAEVKVEYKPAPSVFLQRTDISMDRFWGEFGQRQMLSIGDGIRRTLHQS